MPSSLQPSLDQGRRQAMIRKDYYLVLGVPKNATPRHIKKAFRTLSKTHHPDQAGSQETEHYQDIVEAYAVLSDPKKRRLYNDSLPGGVEEPRTVVGGFATVAEPLAPEPGRRPGVEPLVPEPGAEPMSVPLGFHSVRPSAEELTERFLRNFTGIGAPKSEHAEALNVEVVLSPEAALRGAPLTFRIPVFSQCPLCGGSGRDWYSACHSCRGRGVLREEETVRVRLPAGIRRSGVVEIPLSRSGITNLYLRIHVRVGRVG